MKVIRINEESHGFIGVAKDYETAQNYVIDSWLDGNVDIYTDDKDQTIEEAFGENWEEVLKEMPFEDFAKLLNDQLWFHEETLIGS